MKKLVYLIMLFGFAVCAYSAVPKINITDGKESADLKVKSLAIDVKITGTLAVTTVDMTFENTYSRVLEGELDFPLADGQTVSRYALEINGKMREGVCVDKETGRIAYESTVRRGVDPGLLEKTAGNSYKTRIYPIPAKGTKRVIIAYEQNLSGDATGMKYILPLDYSYALDKFSLTAEVRSENAPDGSRSALKAGNFDKSGNAFALSFERKKFRADEQFEFTVPAGSNRPVVLTETYKDKTYFFAKVNPDRKIAQRAVVSKVLLLFDNSLSREGRNADRESQLLDAYFKNNPNVSVDMITFSINTEPAEHFAITGGNWSELRNRIGALHYDGATDFSVLPDGSAYDEILLLTDGIADFGDKSFPMFRRPVFAINSSQASDMNVLGDLCRKSEGECYNAVEMSEDQIGEAFSGKSFSFMGAEYNPGEIEEIYPQIGTLVKDEFTVSGILKSATAHIKLNFGSSGKITTSVDLDLAGDGKSACVRRIWAGKKLEALAQNESANKDAIIALGKEHTLVTSFTSLIVLDNARDYARYKIEPPEELKAEYDILVKIYDKPSQPDKEQRIKQIVYLMNAESYWFETNFDPSAVTINGYVYYPPSVKTLTVSLKGTTFVRQIAGGLYEFKGVMPGEYTLSFEIDNKTVLSINCVITREKNQFLYNIIRYDDKTSSYLLLTDEEAKKGADTPSAEYYCNNEGSEVDRPATNRRLDKKAAKSLAAVQRSADFSAVPAERIGSNVTYASEANSSMLSRPEAGTQHAVLGTVELKKITYSDSAYKIYSAVLGNAAPEEFETKYFQLRTSLPLTPSFCTDAADFAADKGLDKLSLRILSNLAEMSKENRVLLRTLGKELLKHGKAHPAVSVYREVYKIATEEPQSFRDLALALDADGKRQEAVDTLYAALMKSFDSRFPAVELILLHEMNEIIFRDSSDLDLTKIDSRLRKRMPVGLRIVLTWTVDNTDVDLHVIEPTNEECFFSHQLTQSGGKISRDFTGGYGPEEYMIRKPIAGMYKVLAKFFSNRSQSLIGPVTVFADIYTDWGTPEQKKKSISFRLADVKQSTEIGNIIIAK